MDAYLTKPIRGEDLLRAVQTALAATAQPDDPGTRPDTFSWPAELAEVEDDPELICELAAVFLGEYPKWLAELRAALADGDAQRLQLTAHTVKGSLMIFAAKGAAAAAARLEGLGRSGPMDEARTALTALEEEVERLRPVLTAIARPARPV